MKTSPALRSILPYVVLIALILGALAITLKTTDVDTEALPGLSMELPERVGEWIGTAAPVQQIERDYLGSDTEFSRKIYRRADGSEIFLGIVLSGRDRSSIHAAESCLVGQGWRIQDGAIITVPMQRPRPYGLEMMRLTIAREARTVQGGTVTLTSWYHYWFVGRNRLTARHLSRVLWTAFDRIFYNIHHRWAYVAVVVAVPPGQEARTAEMVKKFIQEATPFFQKTSG